MFLSMNAAPATDKHELYLNHILKGNRRDASDLVKQWIGQQLSVRDLYEMGSSEVRRTSIPKKRNLQVFQYPSRKMQ